MLATFEPENGGIADAPVTPEPIPNDAEIPGVLEEGVDGTYEHQIEVEKQRRPGQLRRWRKHAQLHPSALRAGREFHDGQGPYLDGVAQSRAIVGEADEAVRYQNLPMRHRPEAPDVFRPVLGAPFHADDGCHLRRHRV